MSAFGKLALLLIYQPGGIAPSIFKTCEHLVAKGYAPLVVSNTPVSDRDKAQLLDRCWQLAIRPNLGYDFGGYRDGIWLLAKLDVTPEHLLILNDSTWFPIHPNSDLIEKMEDCDADYVGAQGFGQPGMLMRGLRSEKSFFASYCFMIKKYAFQSSAFQSFWADYRMSSNKEKTLRRGEQAFSQTIFAAGIKSKAIFSRERFEAVVKSLTESDLEDALRYLVCLDAERDRERLEILRCTQRNDEWAQSVKKFVLETSAKKNYIGTSPVVSVRNMGFPMVKKNQEMLYRRARAALKSAAEDGALSDVATEPMAELTDAVSFDGIIHDSGQSRA